MWIAAKTLKKYIGSLSSRGGTPSFLALEVMHGAKGYKFEPFSIKLHIRGIDFNHGGLSVTQGRVWSGIGLWIFFVFIHLLRIAL